LNWSELDFFGQSSFNSAKLVYYAILADGTDEQSDLAVVVYDDGGVHEINSHISDFVWAYDSPGGDTTTVNLASGGLIRLRRKP